MNPVLANSQPWTVTAASSLPWLQSLPADSVHCAVTSPPYYHQRDYGQPDEIGKEATPYLYIANLVATFRELRRVLRPDGTFWLNLGDSHATGPKKDLQPGTKTKDLLLIPPQVALALRADGWHLRAAITLTKNTPMPGSATDRPTRATEMLYMLTKSPAYYYDIVAGRTPAKQDTTGHNIWDYWDDEEDTPADTWRWANEPSAVKHYATFPTWLPRRCLRISASIHGCCPVCSAPHKRQIERTKLTRSRPNEYTKRTGEPGTGNACANTTAGVLITTVGWSPTCKCGTYKCDNCSLVIEYPPSRNTGASRRIDDEANSICEDLPDVPGGVPDVTPGAEVLQHLVQRNWDQEGKAATAQADDFSKNMPDVSEGVQASMVEDSVLQQSLRGEKYSQEPAGEVHDGKGLRSDLQAVPSKGDEGRVHHGASTGDGGTSPASPSPDGSRSSQKRSKERQPCGESGGNVEKKTRQKAKAAASGDTVPALSRVHSPLKHCPACSGEMTLTPYKSVGCVVLDPFAGAGTTGVVARDLGMRFLGCELNPEIAALAYNRIASFNPVLDFSDTKK